MAEDQGVDGDRWNAELRRLLIRLGWEPIGDRDVDLKGSDGKAKGIDGLFSYQDAYAITKFRQGVFVEAKAYATTSLKKAELNKWVNRLSKKVLSLKNSRTLFQKFPPTKNLILDTGLIVIWFNNPGEFENFSPTFDTYLKAVKVSKGITSSKTVRVLVITNDKILQLASMVIEFEKWKKENDQAGEPSIAFHYSSSGLLGNPVADLNVLNLEYMLSDFIFAKGKSRKGDNVRHADIVFYFGKLDEYSFERLAEALSLYGMVGKDRDLIIFKYRREDTEFRKSKDNVIKLLKAKGPQSVDIRDMEILADIPTWMKRDD
jgi:hypothetical protein